MAFTEFFCRSGGSNLNGGALNSNAEPGTSAAYTCTNSNWDGTSVFTPTDGSTPASTVTVGDFASVFLDAATVAVYIARVTAVAAGVNGAITLSTTAKSGTAPTSNATGRTIKVGGAWKGPNAAEGFPFNFITNAATNATPDRPRVNFKNDAQYNITAAMTHTLQAPVEWQGYTTTAGDLGRATIDGGTSGASYVLLTLSGSGVDHIFTDLIFANNGATGNATGVSFGSNRNSTFRCVFHDFRGYGVLDGNHIEGEAYACNKNNTSNTAGFACNSAFSMFENCIAHDNTGSNTSGFYSQTGMVCIGCIADTNGSHGFNINNATSASMIRNCDAYANTGSGVRKQGTSSCPLSIRNNNLVLNGAYGIDLSGSTLGNEGFLFNNGYGSGTKANTSGTVNGLGPVQEVGAVTLTSNSEPWVDAPNGDFRINLAAAKGAGRGAYTQTNNSPNPYAGTIGYPDIGAAQHQDSGGAASMLVHPGMTGGVRG